MWKGHHLKNVYVFRSESVSTQMDELRRIKNTISEFQSDLEDTLIGNDAKLESMKSIVSDLQTRVIRMEARSNQTNKQMNDVCILFY